ncbi:MAG: hypothetical protein B6241_15410 [Spirochaetaceae bacterium 4572_59]|nr:MAG: hypothetical protein B6241_15410 [Spirochaetaceae bacterium 4572_59]
MGKDFLYKKVYKKLHSDIVKNVYDNDDLLPSEQELCNTFDVSLITVRRALNELSEDGLVTKVRGKGTIVQNDFRKVELPARRNSNIAVLELGFKAQRNFKYPHRYDYENLWQNRIYKSLIKATEKDYNFLITSYYLDKLINDYDNTPLKDLDRILLMGEVTKEAIDFLNSKKKYVVVYNNFYRDLDVCTVSNNEREASKLGVEYLIKQGHSNIASINGVINFGESVERSMGFQEALLDNDLPINSRNIKWGDMTPESGYYLTKELLELNRMPSAIFCVNDGVAFGAMDAIKEAGLKCPEDISILGHDNSNVCERLEPGLSSIDPCYDKIGVELARKLTRNIWSCDETIVKGELIIRDSIKSIPIQNKMLSTHL